MSRGLITSYATQNNFIANYTNRGNKIDCLLQSRKLHSIETIEYERSTVCSTDLDPTGNFLLIGLTNGTIDLVEVVDPMFGTIDRFSLFNFGHFNNLHRVQWNPTQDEQFFSCLDNNNLCLCDPQEMRIIDKFAFKIKTFWSEWNLNDRKMIAVCGSESQTRLVDIRSGSSVQSITLSAKSGLASHRATRCLWSRHDSHCLIIGDNEGYLHIYDTRQSSKHITCSGSSLLGGQISGMSFKADNCSIITSHGTENRLVEWDYKNCKLVADIDKFKKRKKTILVDENIIKDNSKQNDIITRGTKRSRGGLRNSTASSSDKEKEKSKKKKIRYLSIDQLLRCQFYVTDRHIFCPVPYHSKKSKEFYIYNANTGDRIKTIKSDNILSNGVYSITGLLPDSLVLYVGGTNRLRVWTIDEDSERKLAEKKQKYHTTTWDSDSDG